MRRDPHTRDFKDRLAKLWAQEPRLSTAQIGQMLGVSKNAVVGQAHRDGLPGRPSPIKRGGPPPKYQRHDTRHREMSQPHLRNQPMRLAVPTRVFGSCQYPVSAGKPWRFCDAPLERSAAVYCETHRQACINLLPREVPEWRRYP